MNILKQISDLPTFDLQDLHHAILAEIRRRKSLGDEILPVDQPETIGPPAVSYGGSPEAVPDRKARAPHRRAA